MDFEANESAGVSRKISRRLSGSARCALVRIDRLSMQKKRGCIQPRKTTGFIQEHIRAGRAQAYCRQMRWQFHDSVTNFCLNTYSSEALTNFTPLSCRFFEVFAASVRGIFCKMQYPLRTFNCCGERHAFLFPNYHH